MSVFSCGLSLPVRARPAEGVSLSMSENPESRVRLGKLLMVRSAFKSNKMSFAALAGRLPLDSPYT
jgi:hypothetical protein